MNLARVLEESVSDLPQLRPRQVRPRLHPKLVVREHEEHDGRIYTMCVPGGRPPCYFRLTEMQHSIVQLFDGERTPEDVVQVAADRLRLNLSLDDLKTFVQALEDADFWYHTPQEKSVALCHHLMQERKRRRKPEGDLAQIVLTSFDPNHYLTWVNKHCGWIYSRWFTGWSFFMLFVCCLILGSHWRQVWADSLDFYNFGGRGFGHFLTFLIIFLLLGAVHETAHGLTCKHFGGDVHRIGAMLVYMTPCIFCDVTEVYVYGDRWERMMTTFYGVWSEVVMCTYASVIWWATAPGTLLHEVSYYVVLSGGILCVLVNWNPFAKMDGYMLFTEWFRMPDIKATSTNWLISWIRVKVFHMAGEVPSVSRLRAICYTGYALLSGFYCYGLLLFFVRILYHIVYYYTPQWAFLPAGLLALKIFRSRIVELGLFMKDLYLDKKELLRTYRKPIFAGTLALAALGLLPLRRDRVTERFLLEPVQRAVLRAQVPGRVVEVEADEGERVPAGAVLVRMRDLRLRSDAARTAAEYELAEARAFRAQMHYADYGRAEQERRAARSAAIMSREKEQQLTVASPIAGVVITPRLRDLLGSYVAEGTELAEVVDTSSLRARILVRESEMQKLQTINGIRLRMDGHWTLLTGTVISISPAAQKPDAGLIGKSEYQGITLPDFFVVTVALENREGELRDGMTGTAKIYGRRRSLLGIVTEPLLTAAARRVW